MTTTTPTPTTTTATTTGPVLLLTAVVRDVQRLSPSFVRIRLGGAGFEHVGPEGPTLDQRVKLLVPPPGRPCVTTHLDARGWYAAWLALPEADRGVLRTYTARAVDGEGAERQLVVDFVLHGVAGHGRPGDDGVGPAGAWAAAAVVGDEIGLVAPRRGCEDGFGGIEFRPGSARRLVLVADETALPALASIAEALPPHVDGVAVVEVPDALDAADVRLPDGMEVHRIVRGERPRGEQTVERLRACLRLDSDGRVAAELPSLGLAAAGAGGPSGELDEDVWETPVHSSSGEEVAAAAPLGPDDTYAWVAGDSDTVKACRRLLVGEAGLPRPQVAFMGYWKQGRPS
ncbi:siderophore-interacting protein [Terrabacter sp. NPDC000476]|uniref:siderophore-interacting protein n=1 Tax=Terrabacter sp. NPDC000476 TaxID=3154258 RepID=UPI00331E7224